MSKRNKLILELFPLFVLVWIASACVQYAASIPTRQPLGEEFGTGESITSTTEPVETVVQENPPSIQQLIARIDCIPAKDHVEQGLVTAVIDGDTIAVNLGGTDYRVRYIGMNSPEMDEPAGQDAQAYNQGLVQNEIVYLLKDASESDQYGRLLRFVFTSDHFVNYELVRYGHALPVSYPPDIACDTLLQEAGTKAREDALGLWQASGVENDLSTSIAILDVFYNGVQGENEPDEYVEIENSGVEPVDLSNWYLKDQGSHRFIFPSFELKPGQICRVYTNETHPESCGFSFKESGSAVWNNGGDCALLFSADGRLVDDFCY